MIADSKNEEEQTLHNAKTHEMISFNFRSSVWWNASMMRIVYNLLECMAAH